MLPNSLARKRPDLAKQWHPTLNGELRPKDIAYSSGKSCHWLCKLGHPWEDTPNIRSRNNNDNCPYCTNRRVLKGFNDLKTLFPKVAKFADGWDPTTVVPGSGYWRKWKCHKGHKWEGTICEVCNKINTCSYCSNEIVIPGVNDLKTTHPNLAKEANGWNPRHFMAGYSKQMPWKCKLNHTWDAPINSRVLKESECKYCKNRAVWVGFNDLATTHPTLASQAYGWDPTTLTAGSHTRVGWICAKEHTWITGVKKRALKNTECPYCNNSKVWIGFNDLATTHPHLIKEAYQWDPTTVTFGSERMVKWKCLKAGHIWKCIVSARARLDTACPTCVPGGFSPGIPAHLYILSGKKDGKQIIQFGISNVIKRRLYQHELHGFDTTNPIALIPFRLGSNARKLEVALMTLMKEHEVPTATERGIRFDGSTESFLVEDTIDNHDFMEEFKELIRLR